MRFSLTVPNALAGDPDRWLAPGALERIAKDVEDAGFDAIAVTDHPFAPTAWLATGGHQALDPFVALSFLAAGSTTIRLFTNILVLPYREPLATAKAIATLDQLSGGRVIVGAAVGYLEAEFDAIGADFAGRGAAFERVLARMREAWGTADTPDGKFHALPGPRQRPHPPIWIGGNSVPARRRAATIGDGWLPFGQPARMAEITGTPPLETTDDLAQQIAEMREARAAAGVTGPFDVLFGPFVKAAINRADASPQEIDDEIAAYAEAGVTWLGTQPRVKTPDDLRRYLDRFAPILERSAERLR